MSAIGVRGPRSPIRPGRIIKQYLLEHGEATIQDLFDFYREQVKVANEDAQGLLFARRTPMAYMTFVRQVQFLRQSGHLKRTRTEPMLFPPAEPNPLLGIGLRRQPTAGGAEQTRPFRVVVARRVFHELTAQGIADDVAFDDPRRAAYPG